MTSEHHNFIFYQKYKRQAFLQYKSYAQLNTILARYGNFLTTTLNHRQKHYRSISKTVDFINKINGVENITEDTFLVTLHVKSLCNNIPNHEGIEAAKEALNSVELKL